MRRVNIGALAIAVISLFSTAAGAQGLLVSHDHHPLPRPFIRPRPTPPPSSYKIKQVEANIRINDQVARVQVSQTFVNTGSRQMQVSFLFPLPYDGAIDRMTLLVDGKEYPAKLLGAKEARSIYEGYVRRNQDPALLEWMGSGMFQTSVFPIPAGAERKVTLHYNQVLRKDHGLTDFLFPLSTAKYTSHAVDKIDVRVTVESTEDIKNIYSPTHAIKIERPDDRHAVIHYSGKNEIPTSDFRLFYDVGRGKLGTSVVSYRPNDKEDGFYLLLATPQIEHADSERVEKTVVFVIDRSGSMSGKKIEQAREAAKFVLNNLREGDLFNIVVYDSTVEAFAPELQRFTDETRKTALGFVAGIHAGGSTNIDAALARTLGMLKDSSRPSYVLFMTDGLPTAGETGEAKIVLNASQHNGAAARMINFGVGFDVNSRLLDRLARANHGQSLYVRPDEDIESHVSHLYDKISAPVLSDVKVVFELDTLKSEDGPAVNRVLPTQMSDLFAGEQLVMVGRYRSPGAAKVTVSGRVGDEIQKFDFTADLVSKSPDDSFAFVEKIWAMRRIGEIIDQLDLKGKNDELIKELVKLSTRHGILTPYTSFLADDTATISDLAASNRADRGITRRATESLGRLNESAGRSGFIQRNLKNNLQLADKPARLSARGRLSFGGSADGAVSGPALRSLDSGEELNISSLRQTGKDTIYKRGKVWYANEAADVDLSKETSNVKVLKQFSKEYFDLVSKNTAAENKLLATQQAGEILVVKFRGEFFRIE